MKIHAKMLVLIYLLSGFLGSFVLMGALWADLLDHTLPILTEKPHGSPSAT